METWLKNITFLHRVHHSKRRLAWPWMTGKKSTLKKSGDTKNIYPEKDYWSQSKNTKEIPALPLEEKLRQVHKHLKQFTPIGLLTSPYTQESQQVKPKIAEPKNVQRNPDTLLKDNEPNGKNQEQKETEIKPENVPWEEVKEWQEENQVPDETMSVKWKNKNMWEPDNAQKDIEAWKHTYLKKSERRRPEEEENYDDDMWQEDNSMKEILRWREPTEDIVYKEKYAELSNQGPGNAKKDIPHWKGKKSMIAAPKWKTADHNNIQNKAREQEEDMVIDIDHPNFEMPRKEFDVATFQNATRTKVKEMVAKQLDSFLCSAESCSAFTKGQDSAALCTGQLCHAVCVHKQCISACTGKRCVAQCFGANCTASCEGKSCLAACKGKNCHTNVNEQTVSPEEDKGHSDKTPHEPDSDDGYYGNKNLIDETEKSKGKKIKHHKPTNPINPPVDDPNDGYYGNKNTIDQTEKSKGKKIKHHQPTDPMKVPSLDDPNDGYYGNKNTVDQTEKSKGKKKHHQPIDSNKIPPVDDPNDGYYGNKNQNGKTKNNKHRKIKEDKGVSINFTPNTEPKDGKTKVDYSIGIHVNDRLADYIKFELGELGANSLLRHFD
ncbi:hypothetical protein B5X24_HaOG210785 [Helicoverpa armigera]|uniref:Uncharacterized protein n=1 Tax=Helicoverpa armigera TaxID=29058 RepID=A0A2W1BIR5_HELAM|nr:hypothetical protein B5X24_HaOG210785 [Helicoverpa armigera]